MGGGGAQDRSDYRQGGGRAVPVQNAEGEHITGEEGGKEYLDILIQQYFHIHRPLAVSQLTYNSLIWNPMVNL